MTTAQTDGDRSVKVAKRMKDRAVEIVRLVVRYRLTHVAEDDTGRLFQQSGLAKMKQHTVPLVGFRADVFKKKNTRAINVRSIRCAECLREDRDTTSIQLAFRAAGSEDAKAVINTKRPGAVTLQAVSPACNVHAVVTRKVSSRHRTVEGDEVGLVAQPAMKGCVVAITDKNLRVGADQRSIKMGKQLSRSPAAPGTEDAIDRRICKCRMQIVHAIVHRSRVIEWPA